MISSNMNSVPNCIENCHLLGQRGMGLIGMSIECCPAVTIVLKVRTSSIRRGSSRLIMYRRGPTLELTV